jgi:hypothetical protein
MSNPSAKPQGHQRPGRSGYEKSDANAPWIFGIVIFLLLAGLIMHFCLAGVMERLAKKPLPVDRWSGTRRGAEIMQAKDLPHLQLTPPEDLQKFRAREESELNSYGWLDRTAGVVRIPIARAMELVLERGLPVRTQTNGLGPSSYQLQMQRPQTVQTEIQEAK